MAITLLTIHYRKYLTEQDMVMAKPYKLRGFLSKVSSLALSRNGSNPGPECIVDSLKRANSNWG
jgi:hypothetical protein